MSQRDAIHRADVVILTAIRLELDAVLDVDAGAVPGSVWEVVPGPTGLPVAFRSFAGEHGPPVRVAAAVSADMGATAAIHALLPLVESLRPRCVAMCGVCAGRRGKTQLGDVVAADRLFFHDTGKQLRDRIQQDLTTYELRDDWKAALEGLDAAAQFRDAAWFQRRPLSTEWREHRALIALRDGAPQPWKAVEPDLGAAAWKRIVEALRERKLLAASGSELTAEGRRAAADLLFEHQGELPDLSPTGTFQPFRLHVAPMGSGGRVIEDEAIWGFVSRAMRKTLALEMESAALGELAHRQRQHRLDVVVMKGVMDFAEHGRDDHFKEFAARASAECLLWFLRQRVPAELSAGVADRLASTPQPTTSRGRSQGTPGVRLDCGIERQRHEGFLGREALLAELDRLLLEDDTDRWVVVTGGPGMGKSAILAAWLARCEAAGVIVPYHFIRRGLYGWDEPAKIVGSLAAQIEVCYPTQCDPGARPESRLLDLLTRVSAEQLSPDRGRLVLVVDGLDEYDAPAAAYDPLAAFLPHALPRGVRFLCASRPKHPYLDALEARDGEVMRFDLDDPSAAADNDATVRAFWRREASVLGLDDRFVEEAVVAARGNLQHAVTLRKHLAGVPRARRRVETIPRGLKSLLTMLWARIATSAVAVRGLGLLCTAREPLSLDELGAAAGWDDLAQRQAFIQATRELLVETRREDGVAEYRLHHEAIRAYFLEQLGPVAVRAHHAVLAQNLATWPAPLDDATRRYALRHALAHRAEAGDWAAVGQLARDLGFLEAKCRELGVHDVEADVARAAERCRTSGDPGVGRDLGDLVRALARESHWLHDEPGALAAQLWNRLRRMGWSVEDLCRVTVPAGSAEFARVRHAVARESPALLRDLVGHSNWVTGCVVTPDGRHVVSASSDKTLKVWDLDTGRVVTTLDGHTAGVTSCAVTPDGRRVVSASYDHTLRVWNLDAGHVLVVLERPAGTIHGCMVTREGRRVVTASGDGTLELRDLDTGRVLITLEGHTKSVNGCAVTPDARRVVSASHDTTLKVWDLDTRHAVLTLEGHTHWVMSCAVTPDGRRVVSASADGTLKVWDLDTGRALVTLEGHTRWVTSCVVTPDGRRVLSTSYDGTVKVWDLDTGRIVTTLEGHTESVNSCAVTPDGRRAVSASSDETLKIWDLDTSHVVATLERHAESVSSCAVTADGRRAVSASVDRTLKVWDLGTGRLVTTLDGHLDIVNGCAVTPDGRRAVSASNDQTLRVWDLGTGHVLATIRGHTRVVNGCAVTPDGRRVVSASSDKTLKVWDLDTGRILTTLEGHTGGVTSCAVLPDGRGVVSASYDHRLHVWNLDTGRVRSTLEGHTLTVSGCVVTPDGRRVVSASFDSTLRVWDLDTGRLVITLEGHTESVNGCAVTPDGRRLVSASNDLTLRIWDLATYRCIAIHRGDIGYTTVAATATTLCAGDAAGTLWFLDWPPSLMPSPPVSESPRASSPRHATTNPARRRRPRSS